MGGWRNDKRVAAGEAAAAGGCGKAELLWMADGNGRALGKRANTKVGEDWHNEKRVAAAREACEHQGWGGLAQR